jgi:phosphoribosyl 1,2-cyclic phosphodiesterase
MDVGAVDEVRVRFWGVRGSIPTPGPGTVRYGGNTSCVSVEAAGHDLLVLDAGSGIRLLGLDLIECKRLPVTAHLFLSHTHWDHIQGFPFFAPAFIPGNSICIYGAAGSDEGLIEALEGQMLHRYFPVTLDELGASFSFQRITPGSHEVGGARITVAPLHHPGSTVGYRLELNGCIVAYVTDTEPLGAADRPQIDPATLLLARDADVLIHDAQYTDEEYPKKVGWGHSPVSHVVDLAVAAGG